MKNAREPVRLRKRRTPAGLYSLYLDIYAKGQRQYEYLHLYLLPGDSKDIKKRNKDTLATAEDIRAKRLVEFRNRQWGFRGEDKSDALFLPYLDKFMSEAGKSTKRTLSALKAAIQKFDSRNLTFRQITTEWIEEFKAYLDKQRIYASEADPEGRPYRPTTKQSYIRRLYTVIHHAYKHGIIDRNPTAAVTPYKFEYPERSYLTIEELKKLSATPAKENELKVTKPFLFACLTGLRLCDILALTWEEVHQQGEFTRIIFTQKKTGGQEYLDITAEAAELMGERGKGQVFKGLNDSFTANYHLKNWVERAGIGKHITFHCARHTFAVMMLDLGTDLYTTSKLLGHRKITTTQIYGKILDKNKQAAVAKIPSILNRAENCQK